MGKYTIYLKLELRDDHGVPFNKDLFKYVLEKDLNPDHSALWDAYCVDGMEIDKIENEDIQTTRIQ